MVESNLPKLLASDNVALLSPSGDVSGASDRAAFVEALANSSVSMVYLIPGTYYINQILIMPSSKYFGCPSGLATIMPTFTSGLGADDRTNAVIKVIGTITGTVNTTLSASAFTGDGYVKSTASVGAGMASGWLRIRGVNTAGLSFSGDSCTAIISEIVQVASGFAGGTTVTLNQTVKMHHISGVTLQSVTPIVDATLEGLFIDASATTTLGSGILIEDSARITVKNIQGKNLSRAVISTYGACHLVFDSCVNRGSTNCTLYRETCQYWKATNSSRTHEGNRSHSLGVPRPELSMRAMCVGGLDDGGKFTNCSGALRQWGGINNLQCNISAHDIDCTPMISRDPDLVNHYAVGSVFDGGPPSTAPGENHAEFGFGCGISNVSATNVRHQDEFNPNGGGTLAQWALYYHDHFDFRATNVSVENIGRDSANVGFYMSGILISDCTGNFTDHSIRGARCGMYTNNNVVACYFNNLIFYANTGESTHDPVPIAFYFQHIDGFRNSVHFNNIQLNGYLRYWAYFGPGFIDRWLEFDFLSLDGRPFYKVKPYTSTETISTVTEGVLGTLTGSSPELARATGPSRKNVVFCGVPQNGWVLAAQGDSTLLYTGTVPGTGDILVPNSTGSAVVTTNQPIASVWYQAFAPASSGYVFAERRND